MLEQQRSNLTEAKVTAMKISGGWDRDIALLEIIRREVESNINEAKATVQQMVRKAMGFFEIIKLTAPINLAEAKALLMSNCINPSCSLC